MAAGESTRLDPAPVAWPLLIGLAAAKALVHVALLGRYGFHRDELYYLVCGRHPSWGYVDHPPLAPLVARVVESIFGPSLIALRLVPAAGGALLVVLTILMVRELGGRAWAQGLAGLALLVSPVYLMTNQLFQTVTLEQLAWVGCSLLLIRILRTGRERHWPWLGLLAGIGLLAKYTMLLFGLGLVLGLALTPCRRQLRSPWLWGAGLPALLVTLPNLLWQVSHGLPSLEFIANRGARTAEEFPPPVFLLLQGVFIGLLTLPLFVAGLAWAFRGGAGIFRPLAWIWLVATAVSLVSGGKPYYPAPAYAAIFAMGAVWVEQRALARRSLRVAWPSGMLVGGLATAWMTLPLVPAATFAAHQDAWPHEEFREMFGWEELVEQVGEVCAELAASGYEPFGLMTESYGEAAALEVLGARHGLPRATSPHDNFYLWGPPETDLVVVVAGSGERLRRYFESVEEVGPIRNRLGVRNQSSRQSIFVCRGPRGGWESVWRQLRSFV